MHTSLEPGTRPNKNPSSRSRPSKPRTPSGMFDALAERERNCLAATLPSEHARSRDNAKPEHNPPSNSQQYRNSAQHRSPPHQVRVRCDLVSLPPSSYPPHRRRKCFSILRLLKNPTKLAPFLTAAPTAPASARRSSPNIFSIPLVFSRRPHVISLIQHTIDSLNKNSYVVYVLPFLYSLSATLFGCC